MDDKMLDAVKAAIGVAVEQNKCKPPKGTEWRRARNAREKARRTTQKNLRYGQRQSRNARRARQRKAASK